MVQPLLAIEVLLISVHRVTVHAHLWRDWQLCSMGVCPGNFTLACQGQRYCYRDFRKLALVSDGCSTDLLRLLVQHDLTCHHQELFRCHDHPNYHQQPQVEGISNLHGVSSSSMLVSGILND